MNDRKLETHVKNKKHAFAKQDEISNGHTPHKRVIYRERWCAVCVTLSGVTRLEHREGKDEPTGVCNFNTPSQMHKPKLKETKHL